MTGVSVANATSERATEYAELNGTISIVVSVHILRTFRYHDLAVATLN